MKESLLLGPLLPLQQPLPTLSSSEQESDGGSHWGLPASVRALLYLLPRMLFHFFTRELFCYSQGDGFS